jgi:hypothetical protein
MENNGEAIMHDMINTGEEDGDGDYTQAETQQDAYDSAVETLFPNGGLSMEEEITAAALAASLASSIADAKRTSQRMASYTPAEDGLLCQAWLEISTYPICGAEQKGFAYWRKVGKFFHEQRKLAENLSTAIKMPYSFSKRCGIIHAECSKFQGSFKKIPKRQISGLLVVDLVKSLPPLSMYLAYALSHCQCVGS